MGCDFPLKAFRSVEKGPGGKPSITFNPLKALNSANPMNLPCGRCTGCRLERSRQWAVRCIHEAQSHRANSFITLTYDQKHLPENYSVSVREWQLFMKGLRHSIPEQIRFFGCGEYGDKGQRPHYHAIIFGHDFPDKKLSEITPRGDHIYTSEKLDKVWDKGMCKIGSVSFESAAYVARYVMKKQTGEQAVDYYTRQNPDTGAWHQVDPEFLTMSRRPGIGKKWIDEYRKDVYPSDFVVSRGSKAKPPRFYDQQLTEEEQSELKHNRLINEARRAYRHLREGRLDRRSEKEKLKVKATIRDQKMSLLKRTL